MTFSGWQWCVPNSKGGNWISTKSLRSWQHIEDYQGWVRVNIIEDVAFSVATFDQAQWTKCLPFGTLGFCLVSISSVCRWKRLSAKIASRVELAENNPERNEFSNRRHSTWTTNDVRRSPKFRLTKCWPIFDSHVPRAVFYRTQSAFSPLDFPSKSFDDACIVVRFVVRFSDGDRDRADVISSFTERSTNRKTFFR